MLNLFLNASPNCGLLTNNSIPLASLVLLDFRLPQQLGLREPNPLNQAFPEQTYNLTTFSIYL